VRFGLGERGDFAGWAAEQLLGRMKLWLLRCPGTNRNGYSETDFLVGRTAQSTRIGIVRRWFEDREERSCVIKCIVISLISRYSLNRERNKTNQVVVHQ
jgi:hypothetical protein